jgi:DNA-binding CsgD family transcriptional regulator
VRQVTRERTENSDLGLIVVSEGCRVRFQSPGTAARLASCLVARLVLVERDTLLLLEEWAPRLPPKDFPDVVRGESPVASELVAGSITSLREDQPPAHAAYRLTPHEVRILRLLTEGHSYKTAAAVLERSIHTVAFHMKQIYAKLHVHSKSEAVAKALRDRIVE